MGAVAGLWAFLSPILDIFGWGIFRWNIRGAFCGRGHGVNGAAFDKEPIQLKRG